MPHFICLACSLTHARFIHRARSSIWMIRTVCPYCLPFTLNSNSIVFVYRYRPFLYVQLTFSILAEVRTEGANRSKEAIDKVSVVNIFLVFCSVYLFHQISIMQIFYFQMFEDEDKGLKYWVEAKLFNKVYLADLWLFIGREEYIRC